MQLSESKLRSLKKEELLKIINKKTSKPELIKLILNNKLAIEDSPLNLSAYLDNIKFKQFINKTVKLRKYSKENRQILKKWEATFLKNGVLEIITFDSNNHFISKLEHNISSNELNLLYKNGLSKGLSKVIKNNSF